MLNLRTYLYVGDFEFPPNKVSHDGLHLDKYNLIIVIKHVILLEVTRPIFVTLDLTMLFNASQHDNKLYILLPDHPPEVFLCRR